MGEYFSTAQEGFLWIESLSDMERNERDRKRAFRLERMIDLCLFFDNPQDKCDVIHIAGSKGKGSTAAFITHALSAAGKRVGLYTSPHLSSYKERFQIIDPYSGQRRDPSEETLISLMEMIRKRLDHGGVDLNGGYPTSFELLTLLAFFVYIKEGCEWVVLETGLGGRLDATNVCKPKLTIITPIEKEHTEYLGDTLEKIAREKGGIIKEGIPLIVSHQKNEVLGELLKMSQEKNAPTFLLRDNLLKYDLSYPGQGTMNVDYHWSKSSFPSSVSLKMVGPVQADNCAVAIMAMENLFPQLGEEELLKGLASASLPGRSQVVSHAPLIVLDGAHTPGSIKAITEGFEALSSGRPKRILIFGCALDKDAQAMAPLLTPFFDRIIISKPGTFKRSDIRALEEIFLQYGPCEKIEIPSEALIVAKEYAGDEGAILVTGSFYLAGEVFDALK